MNRLGNRLWLLGVAILLGALLVWAGLYATVAVPRPATGRYAAFARAAARIGAASGPIPQIRAWERRLGGRLYLVRQGHLIGSGGTSRPLPALWQSLLPRLPAANRLVSLRYHRHPVRYAYLAAAHQGLLWIEPIGGRGGMLPWVLGALVAAGAAGLWALALHWSLRGLENPSAEAASLPEELRPWAGALAHLQERMGEEGRFRRTLLTHLAHTLRTPLTVQRAVLKAMVEDAVPASERERYLQLALLRSEQLAGLVQDLLDWGYLEDGQEQAGVERVAVDRLLEEEMLALHPTARERQVTVRREPGDPQWVQGEPQRIRRICHHLLAHAIAVTPVTATVQVVLTRQGDRVELSVTDQGPAILEAARSRLWERFLRGDGEPGDGNELGLLLVKIWTEALGGSVGAENCGGVGNRLWVRLPAA